MTAPTKLTAFDTNGKPLVRALLRSDPTWEQVASLRHLMEVSGASFTVDDVAAEIGAWLPAAPPATRAARRARCIRKTRSVH